MPFAPAILSDTKVDFQRKLKRAQEEYSIPDDLPTNTPRVFHVETTWKQPFPRRFNVGYT